MATVSDLTKTTQEQVLAAIKQSQDLTLAGIELWAKTVTPLATLQPLALAKGQPLPFAAELPKPEELVRTSFAFAEKVLAAQKDFAEKAVAAAAPVYQTATAAPSADK
jgi:hypothetical protein